MLVFSFYRITGLHYTYGCATLGAAYVGYFFLQNHRALLYLWVSSLKCSLLLLGLVTESLDHTRLIGAQPKVQPMFVTSTYGISELHCKYG